MTEYQITVVYRTYESPNCEKHLERYIAEQFSQKLGIQVEKVTATDMDKALLD